MTQTSGSTGRRTPRIALALAPVALVAVAAFWNLLALPAFIAAWHSSGVLQLRLAFGTSQWRIDALRDASAARPAGEKLIRSITGIMNTEAAPTVRAAAARALGLLGQVQALPAESRQSLADRVLTPQDELMLSAAIVAVGQSAPRNRYSDELVRRIANTLTERHYSWLYGRVATALGQIGAAQSLRGDVVDIMNAEFSRPSRPGTKSELARAFVHIAKERALARTTLDLLAHALENDHDADIRTRAVYALAHSGAGYPDSRRLVTAATRDPDNGLRDAARHGLRIMDYDRDFAGRDPMIMALNPSLPVQKRLEAIELIRVDRQDPNTRQRFLALIEDEDPEVVVAALGKLHFAARTPEDEFDRDRLIPALTAAMSHPESSVRRAALGTLSRLLVHNYRYRHHADEFQPRLEHAARDPAEMVRVVALATLLRIAPGTAERDAIREQALDDPNPAVRRYAASWLGNPKSVSSARQALLDKARADQDPAVREAAVAAQREWDTRERHWAHELWVLWRSGQHSKLGLAVLTAMTVAAPVLIGGLFLIYFMARLLSYAFQRRWRALAVVPVMAIWVAAAYGMFMLYFVAAHIRTPDTLETLQLAGVLWAAIVAYAALGWGMHFAIRR